MYSSIILESYFRASAGLSTRLFVAVTYNVSDFLCCLLFLSEYGALNFSMAAFTDSGHTNKITSGSEPLAVGTRLFIKVEVRSNTEELDLLLERCYATPSTNREDSNQRQFIVGG